MERTTLDAPLETALGNFMAITAKSTVAVVIPLYGFWNDVPNNPVNGELLNAVLRKVYSNVHQLVIIFVANPQSIEHNPTNKDSVGNILLSKAQAGNVLNVAVERDSTYPQYVEEGILAALQDTNASFIVTLNPWVMLQDGCIDVVVDRANYGDNAKIISGFNMRNYFEDQPESFLTFKTTQPKEELDLSLNFLGMSRAVAEQLQIDTKYKTHQFVGRDIWQRMMTKGYDAITSQRIPIFPFDFPWSSYENKEDFKQDELHFASKWGFNPGFTYGEEG